MCHALKCRELAPGIPAGQGGRGAGFAHPAAAVAALCRLCWDSGADNQLCEHTPVHIHTCLHLHCASPGPAAQAGVTSLRN